MVDLSMIRQAGAQIGPSNTTWWEQLITKHGAEAVEEAVDRIHDESRQSVSVVAADRLLEREAKARAEQAADAAEDLAQAPTPAKYSQPRPPVVTPAPPATHRERLSPDPRPRPWGLPEIPPQASTPARTSPITPARPVSTAPVPTPAAAEVSSPTTAAGRYAGTAVMPPEPAHVAITVMPQADQPARSTEPKTEEEPTMKNKALIERINTKRGDLPVTAIAGQIDIHPVTLQKALRTGEFGPRLLPKVEAWLSLTAAAKVIHATADETAAATHEVDTKADTVALDRKPMARSKPIAVELVDGVARPIPQLNRADSYLDQMGALGVAISELARVHPRETAVLARMYAHVADQVADSEET